MTVLVDDTVLVLERDDNGKFVQDESLPLSYLHNNVPAFGDRISLLMDEVVGRYFLRYVEEETENEWITWFVIVEEVDPDFRYDLDESLMEFYKNDVRRFRLPSPTAAPFPPRHENLDRDNRDPAYWTHRRKEILRKEREARLAAIKAEEERKKRKD